MKKKYIYASLAVALAASNATFALETDLKSTTKVDVEVKSNTQASTSANVGAGASMNSKASTGASTTKPNPNSTSTGNVNSNGNATGQASTTSSHGEATSTDHQSVVATYVQSLLLVADRQSGIGQQVRVVAMAQNDAASSTVSAMTKVENRGSLRTFLFGSDYKSLGTIKSELSTTAENIAKLKTLLSQATNDADKAELTLQIKAMEEEQVKLEAYVKAHESVFSLFGWFTKLFA